MKRKPDLPAMDLTHPALSDTRPLFIDNRNGNTLAEALVRHLRMLRQQQGLPWGVGIATAFFDLEGFNRLADDLKYVAKVRLLLGAEALPEAGWRLPTPEELLDPDLTRKQVAGSLTELDAGLRYRRDRLPFDAATNAAITRLLDCLHCGKVEVRRFEDGYLPAKAFIFQVAGGGLLVGSSNFTDAGLHASPGLNLGHYEDAVVGKVEQWFDELWDRSAAFDLASLYERLLTDYPPYLVYLAVLWQLYGTELGEELAEESGIPVTHFQKHGVWRALRILQTYNGVLIADGVGLGKTFLAGEIIRRYRENRQRVLLVCPAALRDSTWKDFLNRFQLFVTCVSYEELARDKQVGGDGDYLKNPLEEYALVVVDEAHNYRNPNTRARAEVLRKVLAGPRRDLVLLTATPVNNSLYDLYYLLRFYLADAALAGRGVLSLKERFEDATDEDPFNLNPDLLYPIVDATTVKRTRQFVKKHYANDLVTLPDGRRVPIKFPKPVPSAITYSLDQVLPGFVDRIEQALMPLQGDPQLTLARYQPENYPAGEAPVDTDQAIVGLIRSGLLKRFESSVHAFATTTGKMVKEHDLFLRGLDDGKVIKKDLMRELSAADDDDEIAELLEEDGAAQPASDYDVVKMHADVEADRQLLNDLSRQARAVSRDNDPKLAELVEEFARITMQADKEGIDDEDRRRKRKVLVFSYYEDTIDWIEEFLRNTLDTDPRLAAYRGRLASVAGRESRGGVSRKDAVQGFAPESNPEQGKKPGADRYDLLLTTDVLAEGLNLQQCRNVINYDLPWNPMRLVQRHGRIDRIGSPHDKVYMRTFFPDQELDRLLKLEERVKRKLAQAARSVGVEQSPVPDGAELNLVFAETREEIEKLRAGDPSLYEAGGTAGAAQSGEEYRQDLRKGLAKLGDQVQGLPWKAGSGLARGRRRGHFFCARVADRVYLRFVPFESKEPLVREMGTCLRLIQCNEGTERVLPVDLQQAAFSSWERARQDVHDAWTRETDPANLQPRISKLSREIAEHLRKYPPRGVDQPRLQRCLDAIEAPCSRREENQLRLVFGRDDFSRDARSKALVEQIEQIGLEPFRAPKPLPPVRVEDVHLVCWLAIEAMP